MAQPDPIPGLPELRVQIDAVDAQLLELLSRRAQLSLAVGQAKAKAGNARVYDPVREAQLLARLAEHRKSVRVQCLRNANVSKHLLQCRVVFHKGLALAHAASHNIPRRVVLADDNGLPRASGTPEMQWRVVLHELPEHSLLPPACFRLLLAFYRKELVQKFV